MTPPQLPLIIGSGPSGHSAATWLHALGLPFVWIDANATLGGTLLRIHHPLQNVPGLIPPPQDGPAWAASLNQQRASLSVPLSQNTLALSLDLINRVALLSSPQKAALSEVSFSHLVLATGTHLRLPVLPHPWNPQKLLNQVFFFSTNQWGNHVVNKPVAILGGGDGALEGALILARHGASSVHLIHRNHSLRARPSFIEAARNHPAIHFHLSASLSNISTSPPPTTSLQTITITNTSGSPQTLPCHAVFIKLGVEPKLPPLDPLSAAALSLDPNGFPMTNPSRQTSIPRIFAVGDLCRPHPHTIICAHSDGILAADAIAQDLRAQSAATKPRG